jgi:NAD+ synthase (glutamine-hydrolysing)
MVAVRIGIAQINACVGDLKANAASVVSAAQAAYAAGASALLTPELILSGYPPEDLLLRPAFIAQVQAVAADLTQALAQFSGLHVVVGHPVMDGGVLRNAASVLLDGKVLDTYFKRELPNYSVFDEQRHFVSVNRPLVFELKGVRFGINICEDIWFEQAPAAAAAAGAQVLLVPNASPFNLAKQSKRFEIAQQAVRQTGCSLIYANLVGGQDELVFDGASFALDKKGQLITRMADFTQALAFVDVNELGEVFAVSDTTEVGGSVRGAKLSHLPSVANVHLQPEIGTLEAQVWEALKLGVKDYVSKSGFKSIILGLSGGIDSAVVMAVAVDALGADKVHAVMMPSRYTADISQIDAQEMAKRLGVKYDVITISALAASFEQSLAPLLEGRAADTTEENIQARVRGTLLMALSNKFGHLVLTTGNKSELSTGYCTLYGDMAGGFAVLKDVAKTLVYRLARWRNRETEVIPDRIITRPPSAELRPDQTDQDSLPPYEVIDAIIERYVEGNEPIQNMIDDGFKVEDVNQIVRLIRINEYKRRQSPPGPRITGRAFGRDWRYPLVNGFRE